MLGLEKHGWVIKRRLGQNVEGGRATWLAHAVDDEDHHVVIKQFSFLKADADWTGYKSHQRELEVLERIDHPQIPDVVGHFQTDDGFCLIQEYQDAPNLAQFSGRWTVEKVLDVARQLLEILAFLQEQRPLVLHRDIKPENVLIDEGDQVYLVDFGFGRIGNEASASSIAVGTPGFMSPEQLLGKEMDERTDLYGVGMTAIALLSGVSTGEIGKLVDETMSVSFDELPRKTPGWVREWLQELVRPRASDRPADAHAALRRLDELERRSRKPEQMAGAAAKSSQLSFSSAGTALKKSDAEQSGGGAWKKWAGAAGAFAVIPTAIVIVSAFDDEPEDPDDKSPASLVFEVPGEAMTGAPITEEAPEVDPSPLPSEGEDFNCRGEVEIGPGDGISKLGKVTMDSTCVLRAKGIEIGSIESSDWAEVHLEDVTIQGSVGREFADDHARAKGIEPQWLWRNVDVGGELTLVSVRFEGTDLSVGTQLQVGPRVEAKLSTVKAPQIWLRSGGSVVIEDLAGAEKVKAELNSRLELARFGRIRMVELAGNLGEQVDAVLRDGVISQLEVRESKVRLNGVVVAELFDYRADSTFIVENSKIFAKEGYQGDSPMFVRDTQVAHPRSFHLVKVAAKDLPMETFAQAWELSRERARTVQSRAKEQIEISLAR